MDIRIQHIKIISKSDVPHFYQEMLLTFSFNENLSSLYGKKKNYEDHSQWTESGKSQTILLPRKFGDRRL